MKFGIQWYHDNLCFLHPWLKIPVSSQWVPNGLFWEKLIRLEVLHSTSVNLVHNAPCRSPPPGPSHFSHSDFKQWQTLLGIKISCSQWKAQGCTQSALLLFQEGQGGWGRVSFHFSLVPNVFPNIILQCVLFHFHLLRPVKPHPHPLHEKNKNHD